MPLTNRGQQVLGNMQRQYGSKKGKQVFHASINKGNPGTEKLHTYGKKNRRKNQYLGR